MKDLDLESMRARVEAARIVPGQEWQLVNWHLTDADVTLLAHARVDIPALIAEVERLRDFIGYKVTTCSDCDTEQECCDDGDGYRCIDAEACRLRQAYGQEAVTQSDEEGW